MSLQRAQSWTGYLMAGWLSVSLAGSAQAQTVTATGDHLNGQNSELGDLFGFAVDIDGDTLLIGAEEEDSQATGTNGDALDNGASKSGAAYVFVRQGSSWVQEAYLKASNTGAQDLFGSAVALSDDTAVVGSYREASAANQVNGDQADDSAFQAGAAYVFVRTGTDWQQQAYLKGSDVDADDYFGRAVAISDDGDTVVVGAHRAGPSSSGQVYVFVRSGTNWTEEAVLTSPDSPGVSFASFGDALSIEQDTLLIAAPRSSVADFVAGAVYVFQRAGTAWSLQQRLLASNFDSQDRFGTSVALDGDTAVVGATWESSASTGVNGNEADNSASEAGAAYVFLRTGTDWAQQAYLKAPNSDAQDRFGSAVALQGDRVIVAATGEDSNAVGVNGPMTNQSPGSRGAVYLFERSGTTWSTGDYLKGDHAGTAGVGWFALGVDLDGDTIACTGNDEANAGAVVTFTTDVPVALTAYCTAKTSSAGCRASISSSDMTKHPVSGATDYYVYATSTQGQKFGLLISGLGAANIPFFGGTLCVLPPFKRGPLAYTGNAGATSCGGSLGLLVNDGAVLPQGPDAGPGNSGYYQFWYRDLFGVGGAVAFSNAIRLDFQ